MAAAARQHEEPLAFISDPDVFGDLIVNEAFVAAYTRALNDLHTGGARTALGSLSSRS